MGASQEPHWTLSHPRIQDRTGGETGTLLSLSVMRLEQRGWALGGISQDGLVSVSPLKAAEATKLEWTVVVSSATCLHSLAHPGAQVGQQAGKIWAVQLLSRRRAGGLATS